MFAFPSSEKNDERNVKRKKPLYIKENGVEMISHKSCPLLPLNLFIVNIGNMLYFSISKKEVLVQW